MLVSLVMLAADLGSGNGIKLNIFCYDWQVNVLPGNYLFCLPNRSGWQFIHAVFLKTGNRSKRERWAWHGHFMRGCCIGRKLIVCLLAGLAYRFACQWTIFL